MTELEIMNFALEFNNLLKQKGFKISELERENRRLTETVNQLTKPPTALTVDEIIKAERPVFVLLTKPYNSSVAKGFYAIPSADLTGVITPKKSVYRYEKYGITWIAYSTRHEIAE
jgi:hypothetical protein